jgi:hypothetical protein
LRLKRSPQDQGVSDKTPKHLQNLKMFRKEIITRELFELVTHGLFDKTKPKQTGNSR